MYKISLTFLITLLSLSFFQSKASDPMALQIEKIVSEIRQNGKAYPDLVELTGIGPRLSGSSGAEQSIQWVKRKMESYRFDSVALQPVKVPHWIRGEWEKAAFIEGNKEKELKVAALGNSAGTGAGGVEASVIEVKSLEEVKILGNQVKGKIVFYNRPMDPSLSPFQAYGKAGDQRFVGPRIAAQNGAVATLVRSLSTLSDDDHPHTGVTDFGSAQPIPSAALSTHGANILSEALKRNPQLKLRLVLSCKTLPPVNSYNVIGEIRGSEFPGEIVLVGAHLDSWDLGPGAHDDGAGVVQAIETLRSIKALSIKPKRTLRAVAFMAEENGAAGAREYARQAKEKKEKHLAAIESDRGGYAPMGFSMDPDEAVFSLVKSWEKYLVPLDAGVLKQEGSGVDVGYLSDLGTATFEFLPIPDKYFHLHHSALDRIEEVDAKDFSQSAAAIAVFAYLWTEKSTQ